MKKTKRNTSGTMIPLFRMKKYKEFKNTQVRRLTNDEIIQYLAERGGVISTVSRL